MNPPGSTRCSATTHAGSFATTHWSVVVAVADSAAPGAHKALQNLCRTYWHPVYAFVSRKCHGPDDALYLTQEFFARFLERKKSQTG